MVSQISSEWESQKNWFAFIHVFWQNPFLPPCIWDLPFMFYRFSKRTLRRMEGKDIRKKRHQIFKFPICVTTNLPAPSCFCLYFFCFWEEVSMSWILNDICRNSLLGNRKKIAKFLKRTFTCRSTFLYGGEGLGTEKSKLTNRFLNCFIHNKTGESVTIFT